MLSIAIAMVLKSMEVAFIHPFFMSMVLVTAIMSSVAYILVNLAITHKPDSVMAAFMISILLRLMFSGIFAFWYLYFYSENEVSFVTQFFILYIVFSAFEIYHLLAVIKKGANTPANP